MGFFESLMFFGQVFKTSQTQFPISHLPFQEFQYMASSIVKFENISKKYGSTLAISDVNLEVEAGEFVFLVGPSGAGKSTLLRLVAKEYSPTSGKILVFDKDIADIKSSQLPFYRRKLGFVFQDFKLLDDRTVFENVAIALEVRGHTDEEINKEVEKILNATISVITKSLKKEGKIQLIGFGSFEVRQRSARNGRNPRTGEPVVVAARRVVTFSAGSKLRKAVA